MALLDTLASLLFPARCIRCGIGGSDFCSRCIREAPPAERESASWIFPSLDYRTPSVRKALWLLKYKGRKRLAIPFAALMYDTFLEELSERALMENFQAPLLVPIPLSGRRRRERGYNQAELLCRELLKAGAGDPVYSLSLATDILFKPEDTEHQARIKHRQKRMENLRGTFVVKNAERITGRNIVLIDDIVTTGATLMEARRVLEAAGARKIIAFTVAH